MSHYLSANDVNKLQVLAVTSWGISWLTPQILLTIILGAPAFILYIWMIVDKIRGK